jgi:predicted ATPase/DNA-binding SARP family transcriptional activator
VGVPVRVEVLGPLRLLVDGRPVEVRGQKRRAVLAMLALAEGRTVPVDRLVTALWPVEASEPGRQALHSQVFRVRGQLGAGSDRLQTQQDGYRLDLGAGELDVTEARSLLGAARTAGRAADGDGAYAALGRAHALWRGPVLTDLTDITVIAAAVENLAQLRRDVTDALVAAAVAAGRAGEVVALAAESVAADPLREPAVLAYMRALAATGQPSQALRVGREYRARLADEAGLDPSPGLDELVREIAAGGAAGGAHGAADGDDADGDSAGGRAVPAGSAPAARRDGSGRPASRLFGRDGEVDALHRLLRDERLVTLVGPGGVGKTRVALEVAQRDPAAPVLRLAPVTDPAAIPHALAAALGLTVAQRDVLGACVAVLADRPGLLVVDNCEHLLDGVRDLVGDILAACPEVRVLATSREPLGLAAECVHRLAPLPLPHPNADRDLPGVPSVAVFLDRAARVRPDAAPAAADLRLVADIVRRLDGMPLAIELAAGRLSTFSLADLHRRLDRSLDLLGGRPSGEARHRTLRETVEWSYRLLSDDERRLFRHLAAFVDGVDLAAAERLADDLGLAGDPGSLLARLVDASMIDAQFGDGLTRYRMLETLRAYGLDRLAAAGEQAAATDHVLRWAVDLTAWIGATMNTSREPDADAALRRELPNLRAAWRAARGRGRRGLDDAVAMVGPLFDAMSYRDLIEIRDWAEELADDPALDGHPAQALVLGIAAEAVYHRGDQERAAQLARAGVERVGADNLEAWYCLTVLSVTDLARGAFDDAVRHALAAAPLAPVPRENFGLAALATAYAGDPEAARPLNERGLVGAESPSMLSWGAYVTAEIDNVSGRNDDAERHYLRAIEHGRAAGATFLVSIATVGLLTVRARAGRVDEALRGYREVVDYFARTGNWTHLWATLRDLATLLRHLGDEEPAALIDAAADQAPDAPADNRTRERGGPVPLVPGRAAVLDVARRAIERNLARSLSPGPARRTTPR